MILQLNKEKSPDRKAVFISMFWGAFVAFASSCAIIFLALGRKTENTHSVELIWLFVFLYGLITFLKLLLFPDELPNSNSYSIMDLLHAAVCTFLGLFAAIFLILIAVILIFQ